LKANTTTDATQAKSAIERAAASAGFLSALNTAIINGALIFVREAI
jgi:hypothetical protein